MAAFGIGILLAPSLGPTLGGWITPGAGFFYLNLPVGLLSLFLMSRFLSDPHYIKRSDVRESIVSEPCRNSAEGTPASGLKGSLSGKRNTIPCRIDTPRRRHTNAHEKRV